MKFEYNGYTLNYEEVTQENKRHPQRLIGKCQEIGFELNTVDNYNELFDFFKREVDKFKSKKDMINSEDRDIILVQQFIADLDKVAREMELFIIF